MIRADLHIHTTISDGSDTIEEVVERCRQKNLTHIAITNHDDMDGYEQICTCCKKAGIKTVKAIEMTTIDTPSNCKAHLLGYGIKDETPIRKLTDKMLARRHQNGLKQIEVLRAEGYAINVEELQESVYKIIYKQNIMQYLVKKGYADKVYGAFYQKYFSKGGICSFRSKDIELIDAVHAIKEGGGYAVLAHPGQQENYELIEKFYPIGLDGAELHHYSNDQVARQKIVQACEGKEMFFTGGSDYHGMNSRIPIEVGDYVATRQAVEIIFGEN